MKPPADTAKTARRESQRRMRGFEPAGGLLREPIRKVGETRGFAVTQLLTHWQEVAGRDLAPLCRPVKISYAPQGGLGATLTLLASGAAAPMVQMQLERLRTKINAIYGYAAIARIRLTQTASHGFAEAQRPFEASNIAPPSPQALARAQGVVASVTEGVADAGLKDALARLATAVLNKQNRRGVEAPRSEGKDFA